MKYLHRTKSGFIQKLKISLRSIFGIDHNQFENIFKIQFQNELGAPTVHQFLAMKYQSTPYVTCHVKVTCLLWYCYWSRDRL